MRAARLYSPAEAAVVAGIAVKAVNNAIDKRIITIAERSAAVSTRRLRRRSLSGENLLQLKLWNEVGNILSQERRERLFDAIRSAPEVTQVRADDLIIIDVGEARKQIAARVEALEEAEAIVTENKSVMGGEPVIKGTRIPVRLIASLVEEGVSEAEILAGYPKLSPRDVALASIWAAAHPRRGRPKPLVDDKLVLKQRQRVPLQKEIIGAEAAR